MNKNKLKLLISGHNGYIGGHFCKYLKKKKVNFTKFNYEKSPKNLSKFTHFFHFEFQIKINKKIINNNSKKIDRVLKICSKNNIKFIFPSTALYKHDNNGKRLSNKISVVNDYASSKLICEKKIIELNKKKDLEFFIFRIFNVYGGSLKNRWVVASLVKKFKSLQKITIANSGNYRDFINISDLNDLFFKSLKKNDSGIFEVGTGKATSIRNLAYLIKKLLRINIKIYFTKPARSKTNFYSKAQIKKTKNFFSWQPKIDLKNGLKRVIISGK